MLLQKQSKIGESKVVDVHESEYAAEHVDEVLQ
jgi:hypothetical protein